MKNLLMLLSALLLLTGCYHNPQLEMNTYAQSAPMPNITDNSSPTSTNNMALYNPHTSPQITVIPTEPQSSYSVPIYAPQPVPYTQSIYTQPQIQTPYTLSTYSQAPVIPTTQPSLIQTIVIPRQDSPMSSYPTTEKQQNNSKDNNIPRW